MRWVWMAKSRYKYSNLALSGQKALSGKCQSEDCLPLSGSVVTHHFQALRARAGLPRKRFHDLRHSAASFMLAQGVPMRTAMEVLGHSEIGVTANLYSHVAPELKRDAADRVSELLWGRS